MLDKHAEVFGSIQARDWLAALAMQGILASGDLSIARSPGNQEVISEAAYQIADVMLAASKQPS